MGYHRATFGIGSITAIDAATPNQAYDVAIVRGISIEFKSTSKPLKGNQLMAVDDAISDIEITGKIQTADSLASIAPLVIPGTTTATGRAKMALESAVPTANQITVSLSANFRKDLGVVDITSGRKMTRAADGTTQASLTSGQYTVAAGVYTFATADASHTFATRYSHNVAASGKTRSWSNQAVGASSGYQLEVYEPTGGTKEEGYFFPAVKFHNASGGMKIDDWTESSFDFTVYADATGKAFEIWSEE